MSFMSYSEKSQSSDGIVEVRHCRLRPRPTTKEHRHADIVESYVNTDTGEARWFYRPLLMSFNGVKIELQ